MRIPYFKAVGTDGRTYQGFYFAIPETTYCFTEDYERNPVRIIHCIANHSMTDWSMPNTANIHAIDINTLEQIGTFDASRKAYGTENWYDELEEQPNG